jgi:hypothetical protein
MGIGLSYFVYNQFAPKGKSFFLLAFYGYCYEYYCISCSCIVQERGIHKTRLGQLLLHVPLLTILRLGAYLQLLLQ